MKLYRLLQTENLGFCGEWGRILETFIDCSNTHHREKKRSEEIINPDYRVSPMTMVTNTSLFMHGLPLPAQGVSSSALGSSLLIFRESSAVMGQRSMFGPSVIQNN